MDVAIQYKGKYKGYDVYESPECHGFMSTIIKKKEGKRVILYNGEICNDFLSEEFNAMIEHEIGHIVLKHSPSNINVMYESEADLYSAKEVGVDVIIQTLIRAVDIVNKLNDVKAKNQLIQRIKILEEYKSNC